MSDTQHYDLRADQRARPSSGGSHVGRTRPEGSHSTVRRPGASMNATWAVHAPSSARCHDRRTPGRSPSTQTCALRSCLVGCEARTRSLNDPKLDTRELMPGF